MSGGKCWWILKLALFFLLYSHQTQGLIEFTNVKCETFDESMSRYEYCFLKSVNRSFKYFSMYSKVFKLPIESFGASLKLYKRSNGFKPFLFQTMVQDGCKFLSQKTNKIASLFLEIMAPYSNLNVTCPIKTDIWVEKLPISHVNKIVTSIQVLPKTDYYLETLWYIRGVKKASVIVYFTFK